MAPDPWSVLGIDPSVSYEDARQAYRRRSRLLHPDRHPEADSELRKEAERAMAALNDAWQTIEPLLSGRVAEPSQTNHQSSSSKNGPAQKTPNPEDFSSPDECLDWALGALIEGGHLQGDPLSSSEITRALQPISKEAGKRGFDRWLEHRTTAMQAAMDADTAEGSGDAANNWTRCYECLDRVQSDQVIMMMLDEVLDNGTRSV
jgi:hypothetical protein